MTLVAAALGAGIIADLADRRTVLLGGNACLGLAYVGLWLDAATGRDSVTLIVGLVGLQGIGLGAATGVLLAGLVSGAFTRTRRHGALMTSAALAWGGCVVLLGLTADLRLGVLALVAGGMVNMVLSTTRNAITQAHAEDAVLGRMQGSTPQLWRYDGVTDTPFTRQAGRDAG